MRWPLWCQILVPFCVVMLVVLVAVSSVTAYLAAERTERQIKQQLREVVRTLAHSTFPLTEAVLRQMRGFSGAEFVLADEQGNPLASSGPIPAMLPQGSTETDDWRVLRLDPSPAEGPSAYFHTRIRLEKRGTGGEPRVLHLLYPETSRRAARREAALPPLVLGAGGLALLIVLASGIARRLSRPIQNLRQQAERIAQGDFQHLSVPQRNDELRDLILSVNQMAGQLDDLTHAARRSERMALLGQLSGGMAHHLRNGVTGARMAVQLHQRRCDKADPESLEVALRQLTLVEGHLKRFLALGRPEKLRRSLCDLETVVRDVVFLVEPSFRHHKVRLNVVQEGELGALEADAEQLGQAVMNLVLNARDAAGPGGWVRLELATNEPGQRVLRVLDSGPGPPPEMRSQLFEAFTTSKPEGVGLGLAVARQIVESHRGTLRFVPRPDTTCFELCLPGRSDTASANRFLSSSAKATL